MPLTRNFTPTGEIKQKWESYDPDYNIYWKNSKTGERASILDAAISLDEHMPCNLNRCGWDITSHESMNAAALADFTSYVTIVDREKNKRMTFVREDIDENAILTIEGKAGTYCELRKKNCRDGFYLAKQSNLIELEH